ncbi:MAG: hypothetical protein C0424_08425 [Sphingobacteriaceae bacterium]|nr:hypothetical protein [Sphingobacteriaceae bacterium]
MRPEVVVVSGASRGIGAATVRLLGAKGYRLALLARNGSEMQQLVKDAGLAQGQYLILEVDLTQSENLSSVIKQIVAHFERIDVLVNNAGMGKFGPMENISVKEMMELFQLNVFAGFALTQSVLPHFKAQNAGVFVKPDAAPLQEEQPIALPNLRKMACLAVCRQNWKAATYRFVTCIRDW